MLFYFSKSRLNVLTFFVLLITLNSHSQCTENASDFGNNQQVPSYNISGDVTVTLNTDDTVTLNLASNFSTAAGPDVRAYLVNSNGLPNTAIRAAVHNIEDGIDNLDHIAFGLVNATGEQSFTIDIPSDKDITSFDKIFFYCLEFEQFWDIGSFSSFDASSCGVLSVAENTLNNIAIFPNPATSNFQLSNLDFTNTEIRIFDVSGRMVLEQLKGSVPKTIDISNFKKGLYVLSISENKKRFSTKLMVQ